MLIHKLFAEHRDPTRELNEVVDAASDIKVGPEIDEYVFTEGTRDFLKTLIEGILDTSQGLQPDCIRTWIAGFFGSGKSHFLKLAAALLENRPVRLDGTIEQGALDYAIKRHGLQLSSERITREFKIKAIRLNLALAHGGTKQEQAKPLYYRLMSELNQAAGFSAVPHVADLERELQRSKAKWDAFLAAVKRHLETCGEQDENGAPLHWMHPEIRDLSYQANCVLEAVLPEVKPVVSNPRAYLKEREEKLPSPTNVVTLAVDVAKRLHPDLGRLLLCVDEVALYLMGQQGFSGDRVREVQGLAEAIKGQGEGRVFLLATAQLRVEEIDSSLQEAGLYTLFLRDRFPKGGRLYLEERDIDCVIRERWLAKDRQSPAFATLAKLVNDHAGLLARAAKLSDESLLNDLPPLTDADSVLAYYPLLPHHVRLLQNMLTALRVGNQVDLTAASSRALLSSVRSLFLRENGGQLADAEIGRLATFDRVYDVIRDVVRRKDGSTDQQITGAIHSLGSSGAISISSVAKVVFLLHILNPPGGRRIRVSPENVAALLYPALGTPWDPHLADVRAACKRLLDEHYIGEDPESGYRFYHPAERTFQKEVDEQPVSAAAIHDCLKSIIEEVAEKAGLTSVLVAGWHKLPVSVTAHFGYPPLPSLPDTGATPRSLEVHVVWPSNAPAQQPAVWAAQYAAVPHVVLLCPPADSQATDLVRQAIKLEAAIREYANKLGEHAAELLGRERTRLQTLIEVEAPKAVRNAIESGLVIHRGVDTSLAAGGRPASEVFRKTLDDARTQVFTEIETGCVQVDDAGLRKVLAWQAGQPQPDIFQKLRLMDASGSPLVDRPFLKGIALALQGQPENLRTGKSLLERLAAAPYGWPERAVKAGLAALLRARRLTAKLNDGTRLRTPDDGKADGWLTGKRLFDPSILELSDLSLTPEERQTLTRVFETVFGTPGLDTMEKLEKKAPELMEQCLAQAREAHEALDGRKLPGVVSMASLVGILQHALMPDQPAGRLKELLRKTGEAASPGQGPVERLKPLVDLLRAVERLRSQRRLDAVAAAGRRATSLYRPWQSEGGDKAFVGKVDALAKLAAGEELLGAADRALEMDGECFKGYAEDYRKRHEDRKRNRKEALDQIQAHPAWSRAAEDLRRQLVEPFADLDCTDAADLALAACPDGTCPLCSRSFRQLKSDLDLIELHGRRALERLEEGTAPPPPPPSPQRPAIVRELRTADDLQRLHQEIEEAARKELGRTRVRVTFEDLPGADGR